jgi:hypothetical protein
MLMRIFHACVAGSMLLAAGAQAAEGKTGSGYQDRERYALFVALKPPHQSNRATLQKMLKAEGYESSVEGDEELVLVLSAAQLKTLFQAQVRMRTVAASASSGMITQPTLESARIPRRFEKLIERVYFDPQRS